MSSHRIIAGNDVQHSVLDLLLDVILAVRLMDLDRTLMLVDGRSVDLRMEILKGHRQDIAFVAGGMAHIVIAGIVPAADVDSRNDLEGLEGGRVVITLYITVDMVAHRSHLGVVHVACIVPDLVLVRDPHVAHLVWQEVLHHRLPHSPVVYVRSYPKDRGTPVPVMHGIESFLLDIGEIHLEIVVAQESAVP